MNTLNKYIWSLSPLFRKLLIVLTKYVVYVLCLLLLIDYSEKLIAYDIEKDSFTIYEFIELTKESYNGDIIKKLL